MDDKSRRAGLLEAIRGSDPARRETATELWGRNYPGESIPEAEVVTPPTRGPIPDPAAAVAARRGSSGGGTNWLRDLSKVSNFVEPVTNFVQGPLQAGAARFNRDITGGLYPKAMDLLGIDTPERRAKLAEDHPTADMIGGGTAAGAAMGASMLGIPLGPAVLADQAAAQVAAPVLARAASPLARALVNTATNAGSSAFSGGLQSLVEGESPAEGAKRGFVGGVAGTALGGTLKKAGDVIENTSPLVADYFKAKAAGLYDLPILKNQNKLDAGLGQRKVAESALKAITARHGEIVANQKALHAENQEPSLGSRLSERDRAQAKIKAQIAKNTDERDGSALDPVLDKALRAQAAFLGETPPSSVVRPSAVPEMVQEDLPMPGRAPIDTRQAGYPPLPGPLRDPQGGLPFSPFRKDWNEVTAGAEMGSPSPRPHPMVQENLELAPDAQLPMRFPRGEAGAARPTAGPTREPPDPFAPMFPVRTSPELTQEGLPVPGRPPSGEYIPGYPAVEGPARTPLQRKLPLPEPAPEPPPEINPPPTLRTALAKLAGIRRRAGFDNRGAATDSQIEARAEYAALKAAIDDSLPVGPTQERAPRDFDSPYVTGVRQSRADATEDAAAARRLRDLIFRSEQPVGSADTSRPIEADDDLIGLGDELGPVATPGSAPQPMRVSKENQGAKFLGRAGDLNVPGNDAHSFLEEVAAMDPEFAFQLALVRAKKAYDATRFSLKGRVPTDLAGTNEGMGAGKAIRQNARVLTARLAAPTLTVPESLRKLGPLELPGQVSNPLSLSAAGEDLQRAGRLGLLSDPLDAIRQWYASIAPEREKARAALASPVNTVRDWYQK